MDKYHNHKHPVEETDRNNTTKKSAKKLKLSPDNKMIAGVCGGFAAYFNIDPTLVRIIFITLAVISSLFPIAIFYIACWAIFPRADIV